MIGRKNEDIESSRVSGNVTPNPSPENHYKAKRKQNLDMKEARQEVESATSEVGPTGALGSDVPSDGPRSAQVVAEGDRTCREGRQRVRRAPSKRSPPEKVPLGQTGRAVSGGGMGGP